MQVSVIIVNFNSGKYLHNCLKSIFDQVKEIGFEVIVVDNGSNDDAIHEICNRFAHTRIITNPGNAGFGAANNTGAGEAAGDYLFFLNPDTVLMNDCLSLFTRFLAEKANDAASCGGRLETPDGGYSVSFGHLPSIFQQFSDIGFRLFYKGYYNSHLSISPPWSFDTPQPVAYISGADIFIKKDIFLNMGGFDERFFMYFEDTDLFFRLSKAGYRSFILPEARIVHYGGTAVLPDGSFNYAKYAMTEKSKYFYFAKNVGPGSVFWLKIFQILSLIIHYKGRYRYDLRKMAGITLKTCTGE